MYTHLEMVSFYYDLIRNFDSSTIAASEDFFDAGEL